MKISFLRIFGLVFLITLSVVTNIVATDSVSTTDALGSKLSIQLYCDAKGLFQGSLGMAIGMLMVFGGIWSMARGGKIAGGIILIAFGGMFTALPSIVESTLSGLGNLMISSGMSDSKTAFTPPTCASTTAPHATAEELDSQYRCTGGYLDCK